MNEETSTPYVSWEYYLITPDGGTETDFRSLRRASKFLVPGGGWQIEFMGQTRGGEALLANYFPPDDQDAREWLKAFGSESLPSVPVRIDTYFGPSDEPEDPLDQPGDDSASDPSPPGADLVDAGHAVYIGHGWASCPGDDVIVTIPPEVFRDSALSLLCGLESQYADIDQRIFRLFEAIDPGSYERFLSAVHGTRAFPSLDPLSPIRRPRTPTYEKARLTTEQMVSVLSRKDGAVSAQQLHTYIPCQERSLKKWLGLAGLLEMAPKRLTGMILTSDEILNHFVPWLRDNRPTPETMDFVRNILEAGLLRR